MGTNVKLYRCFQCHWIMDEADTSSEKPCKNCDCRMMKPAHPTKSNVLRYFIGHPRMLILWIKELVLGDR